MSEALSIQKLFYGMILSGAKQVIHSKKETLID